MTEKLTLEYLLKYWNPYLKISYGRLHWDIVRINFNVTKDQLTLRRLPSIFVSVPISDCKLILRPLSSLTEDEYNKICDRFLNDTFEDMPRTNGNLALPSNFCEAFTLILDVCNFESIIEFIDYLRSINIDIDNLQEKGVAVYE